MRPLLALLAAACLLAACGKKGPNQPPGPTDRITYPKTYPAPQKFPSQ
jgi:predicted small lipoprotein YifL